MQAATAAQLQQYIEAALRQSGTQVPRDFAARFSAEFLKILVRRRMPDLIERLKDELGEAAPQR